MLLSVDTGEQADHIGRLEEKKEALTKCQLHRIEHFIVPPASISSEWKVIFLFRQLATMFNKRLENLGCCGANSLA